MRIPPCVCSCKPVDVQINERWQISAVKEGLEQSQDKPLKLLISEVPGSLEQTSGRVLFLAI